MHASCGDSNLYVDAKLTLWLKVIVMLSNKSIGTQNNRLHYRIPYTSGISLFIWGWLSCTTEIVTGQREYRNLFEKKYMWQPSYLILREICPPQCATNTDYVFRIFAQVFNAKYEWYELHFICHIGENGQCPIQLKYNLTFKFNWNTTSLYACDLYVTIALKQQ